MRINYHIIGNNILGNRNGTIVINGKLLFWGTLMCFDYLRDTNWNPLNGSNVWSKAKYLNNSIKNHGFNFVGNKSDIIKLLTFLAFNKECGMQYFMNAGRIGARNNEYILCDSLFNNYIHFSIHYNRIDKTLINNMGTIQNGNNFYYDSIFDFNNKAIIIEDPIYDGKKTITIDKTQTIIKRERIFDDFKRLKVEETYDIYDGIRFCLKEIDKDIVVGISENFSMEEKAMFLEEKNIFIKDGILIKLGDDYNQPIKNILPYPINSQ